MGTADDPTDDLQISSDVVDAWASDWEWDDLSKDMLWLASHFWATLSDGSNDAGMAWHHLVLAVGNFKRQTPIQGISLARSDSTAKPRASFPVPGRELTLAKADSESWSKLEADVRGFGVPTVSTLLSVLWPDFHVVIDRFAFRSAVALRASADLVSRQGRKGEIRPDDTEDLSDQVTWLDYDDYRRWVSCTADAIGRSIVMVERTLYRLRIDNRTAGTWAHRGADLRRHAALGPSS